MECRRLAGGHTSGGGSTGGTFAGTAANTALFSTGPGAKCWHRLLCARRYNSLRRRCWWPCSHINAPPHALHCWRRRPCLHTADPPYSVRRLRWRSCAHIDAPPHSLHFVFSFPCPHMYRHTSRRAALEPASLERDLLVLAALIAWAWSRACSGGATTGRDTVDATPVLYTPQCRHSVLYSY